MPNFKEFIKGFEEKPEAKNPNPAPTPKTQEVKAEQPKPQPKDNYVIFKENGLFRGTPRSNYNAKVRDANKIQDYDDFTSHEQIRDYLIKYGSDKDPNAYEFEDYEPQSKPQPKQGSFEQAFDENEPRMLYVVYDTPQGKVGDYIELDPDMSEDDIIDQLKENENVVGVYGGATNAGAFDPKWVRE